VGGADDATDGVGQKNRSTIRCFDAEGQSRAVRHDGVAFRRRILRGKRPRAVNHAYGVPVHLMEQQKLRDGDPEG
jgi:hypothetical protein